MNEEALQVITDTLTAEVVSLGVLRVRPSSDHDIAFNIMDALDQAGFQIVRKDASNA